MKSIKFYIYFLILFVLFHGCKKNDNDTSYISIEEEHYTEISDDENNNEDFEEVNIDILGENEIESI